MSANHDSRLRFIATLDTLPEEGALHLLQMEHPAELAVLYRFATPNLRAIIAGICPGAAVGAKLVFDVSDTEQITVTPGWLESSVERGPRELDYSVALDGLESLLLALVTAGVDLSGEAARGAVKDAVEAIANQYAE